jgi:hypothetical protein
MRSRVIDDGVSCVKSNSVEMELFDPVQSVLDEKSAHLLCVFN